MPGKPASSLHSVHHFHWNSAHLPLLLRSFPPRRTTNLSLFPLSASRFLFPFLPPSCPSCLSLPWSLLSFLSCLPIHSLPPPQFRAELTERTKPPPVNKLFFIHRFFIVSDDRGAHSISLTTTRTHLPSHFHRLFSASLQTGRVEHEASSASQSQPLAKAVVSFATDDGETPFHKKTSFTLPTRHTAGPRSFVETLSTAYLSHAIDQTFISAVTTSMSSTLAR